MRVSQNQFRHQILGLIIGVIGVIGLPQLAKAQSADVETQISKPDQAKQTQKPQKSSPQVLSDKLKSQSQSEPKQHTKLLNPQELAPRSFKAIDDIGDFFDKIEKDAKEGKGKQSCRRENPVA